MYEYEYQRDEYDEDAQPKQPPELGSLAAAVNAGNAVMARHRSGEISLLEANRLVDQIVKGVE